MKKNNSKKIKELTKKFNLNIFASQFIYLAIILLLFILVIIVKPKMWMVVIPLLIITAVFALWITRNEVINKATRVSEIEKSVGKTMKKMFDNILLPVMVLNKKNDLIWTNKKFSFVLTPEDLENLILEVDSKAKAGIYQVEMQNNFYEVFESNISIDDETFKLLFFIDKTNEKNVKQELENNKLCVGTIVVDNYEEMLQGLDEMDRVNVVSAIDKEIRKWGKDTDSIVSKLEKDRYIIMMTTEQYQKIKEKQFEIIYKFRKITDLTKIPLSLSIGMTNEENTLYERYKASLSALDIALGRGGDQVVVKENGKYEFFGDSSIKLEKMSKVRARTIAQATRELIEKSDKVYIVGHKNSDIDCLGAAVGFCKIAKKLGTPVHVILDVKYDASTKTVIEKLQKSEDYDGVFISKDDIKKQDFENALLIIVDTHKKSYLAAPEILDNFEKVILVDHHRRGQEFIDNTILSYHEVYASSTSELVTELLMYYDDIELTQSEAEAMYAGILIDTKNFTFKTGVRTFEAAAYLKRVGLDITEVKQIFQNNMQTYMAKLDIIRKAEFIDGNIAISVCEEKMENLPIIAAQAADELLSISEVMASFVLCKVDDVVMISARSMGDINVQLILEKLGGGGHLTFAGAQIAGVELEEAKETLLEAIEQYKNKEN